MANNRTMKRISTGMKWAMKRPWKVSYRNMRGNQTRKILKNGTEKDKLLRKLDKRGSHVYGINNLTDRQIQYYGRNGG